MELESAVSLVEDSQAEGFVAHALRTLRAQNRLGQLVIHERHRSEDREPGLDGRV